MHEESKSEITLLNISFGKGRFNTLLGEGAAYAKGSEKDAFLRVYHDKSIRPLEIFYELDCGGEKSYCDDKSSIAASAIPKESMLYFRLDPKGNEPQFSPEDVRYLKEGLSQVIGVGAFSTGKIEAEGKLVDVPSIDCIFWKAYKREGVDWERLAKEINERRFLYISEGSSYAEKAVHSAKGHMDFVLEEGVWLPDIANFEEFESIRMERR